MPHWHNWSGKLTAKPAELRFIRSVQDARAIAGEAGRAGRTIRTAGATHSHAPLVVSDDLLLDCKGLAGVRTVDTEQATAWLGAGSPIYTLGEALHRHQLALINQGDIDEQTIAGAVATGTHGTGLTLQNLSASVVGLQLATADGDLVVADRANNADLWRAARLHLGAFGIVTAVKLQLRPSYCLKETSWQAPLEAVLGEVDHHAAQNRHFEFFWYPQEDLAQAKTLTETDLAPTYPLGAEGSRCAWSFEVLPNHRPHKHTEMEYSIPAEHGVACMRELRTLLEQDFPDIRWPVEYRTLAADDVWLSTAYERDTVTLSVHQDVRVDDSDYFHACEEVFLQYGGRPHWGKVNYQNGEQLAAMHPRWTDWWQERDRIDPQGTFLNSYLTSIRPK